MKPVLAIAAFLTIIATPSFGADARSQHRQREQNQQSQSI